LHFLKLHSLVLTYYLVSTLSFVQIGPKASVVVILRYPGGNSVYSVLLQVNMVCKWVDCDD